MIVFVKTADRTHAVLIPTFDDVESVPTFLDFLKNDRETIHVTTARFDFQKQTWYANPNRRRLIWTKAGILYPDENLPIES